MDRISFELEKSLKNSQELEDGVFVHISLVYCGKEWVARRDIYTVKGSIVYAIQNDGSLYATGDSLWSVKNECHRIGKYDPNKDYSFSVTTFSYKRLKKVLNL